MKRLPERVHHCRRSSVARAFWRNTSSTSVSVVELLAPICTIAVTALGIALQPCGQRFGCDDIDDLVLCQVAPAIIGAQPIDHHDLIAALRELLPPGLSQ